MKNKKFFPTIKTHLIRKPQTVLKDTFILSLMERYPRVYICDDMGYVFGGNNSALGYYPTKERILFSSIFPDITHELAHHVEMVNKDRLLKKDWGFKTSYSMAGFLAYISRETRVRAIQRHFDGKTHYLFDEARNGVEIVSNALPLGRFKSKNDLTDYIIDLDDRVFRSWNKDRIEYTWREKMDFLSDWMES